jgi:hypothetical protein
MWGAEDWTEAFRGIELNGQGIDMAEFLSEQRDSDHVITDTTLKLVAHRIATLQAVAEQSAITDVPAGLDHYTLVEADDWQGLYRNGTMVGQHHHMEGELLNALPNVTYIWVDVPEDVLALGLVFPEVLDDIPMEWRV